MAKNKKKLKINVTKIVVIIMLIAMVAMFISSLLLI